MFLYVYDCASGQFFTSSTNPVSIGNTPNASVQISSMQPGLAGVLMIRDGQCHYYPKCEYTVMGQKSNASFPIEMEKGVLVASNGGLFQIIFSNTPPAVQSSKFAAYTPASWFYFNIQTNSWQGPIDARQLYAMAGQLNMATWVTMGGMVNGICTLADFCLLLQNSPLQQTYAQPQQQACAQPQQQAYAQPQQQAYAQPQQQAYAQPQQQAQTEPVQQEEETYEPIDECDGQYLCPVCWLRFDAGDVMSIASHPDLMGDPVLGRHEMKRFFATQFNTRGQALDEKGMPCMHLACPHCRHKLPPRFLVLNSLIFSIIGAPSSGKSYFLATFIHEMAYKVAPEFGFAWRDADPTGNSQLNDVSNRLFSADSPEQAYLSKTDLEGALYEDFYRHGRMVKLPKPFIFNVSKPNSRTEPLSLVFYDNAGEHFEPGRNNEDSPGAMHVAVASGLFFLFDPTTCQKFRHIITHHEDPQLQGTSMQLDQQSIIMAETESRIASILNISPGEQLDTPFAVLIGKCDLWEDYLSTPEGGGRPLLPATAQGRLIRANVDANSERLRSLLMKIQPTLCSTAESISKNVRYFAISQLGASPETFEDPLTGVTRIGPDPKKISPKYLCDPMLWMLNQLAPEYVPVI